LTRATPPPDATVIAGLRHFLATYVAQRSASPFVVPHVGLARFFDKAHSLLARPQTSPPVTATAAMPSPQRLTTILASLSEPLRRSRANGDFLQIWSVAGLKRNELQNAAVLAWLIDPKGSHGYGSKILSGFLLAAAEQAPSWPLHGADLSRVTVHTEERPLGSDRDRVDIAIDGPDFVLFVEVKIDAPPGPLQLQRYTEAANDKARAWRKTYAQVIYLSPRRPPPDLPPGIVVLTWRRVARALSGVPAQGVNGSLVHQYARYIRSFS
jgi:hypothetical protein